MAATTQGITFTHAENTELEIRICPTCGITYALPARVVADRRAKAGSWYCPNGHTLSFKESDADRARKEAAQLRKKLDDEKQNAEWWKTRSQAAQKAADHQESRANGYKGALTKVKKRVCPCCSRCFVDLGRHMQSKHPTFAEPVS